MIIPTVMRELVLTAAALVVAAVASSDEGLLRMKPGYEYRYVYEATSRLHGSDAVFTEAKLAITPLPHTSDMVSSGEVVCVLEVRHFRQRSQVVEGREGTHSLGTNHHDYSRWFSFAYVSSLWFSR